MEPQGSRLSRLTNELDALVTAARTTVINVIVVVEIIYLFNCRSLTRPIRELGLFSNPWVWGGVLVMTALQIVYTYVPLFNTVFGSHPMSAVDWVLVLGISLLISLVVAAEKAIRFRKQQGCD